MIGFTNMFQREIVNFRTKHLGNLPKDIDISELKEVRRVLFNKGLIGKLELGPLEGYNYGNLSVYIKKDSNTGMLISCRQTSSKQDIEPKDFALVKTYDPKFFYASYFGENKPSSETPLHWSAYESCQEIGSVIHAHIIDSNPLHTKFLLFF